MQLALWGMQLAEKSETLKTASAETPAATARRVAANFILMVELELVVLKERG